MHIVSDDDSSNGKNKEGNRKSVEGYTRVVREDLNEKTACEQRSEESEGGSHVIIWTQTIPGKRNNECKGPVSARTPRRKSSVAGERRSGMEEGKEFSRIPGGSEAIQLLIGYYKNFDSYMQWDEKLLEYFKQRSDIWHVLMVLP